jgi:hypothetical protein
MPEELTPAYEARESNGSEREVLAAMRTQLLPGELLLESVRISDPKNGDIEADFIVLFPDAGAAIIEVKGGEVSYDNGEWVTKRKNYSRRIHPIQQARGAKHALRRYLDRQPEWSHGLIRSQWFIVMPHTPVTGDFGPEGRREQLIGSGEIGEIRDRLRKELLATELTEQVPPAGWVEDVYSLLMRANRAEARVASGATSWKARVVKNKWWVGAGIAAATAVVIGGSMNVVGKADEASECEPGYTPCVPVTRDLDCDTLGFPVEITGQDVYGLDRDGDGIGCETNG